MGICVTVMATIAGQLVKRLTRSPEGLNCNTCSHKSLTSPLQFHSSFLSKTAESASNP